MINFVSGTRTPSLKWTHPIFLSPGGAKLFSVQGAFLLAIYSFTLGTIHRAPTLLLVRCLPVRSRTQTGIEPLHFFENRDCRDLIN